MNSIYLADGREIKAEVQPHSYRSRIVQFEGREIIVEKLAGAFRDYGYGERVEIHLKNGETTWTVLQPHEYEHHVAIIDVGAIEWQAAQFRYPEDIILPGKPHIIQAIYDQGQWREMTDEEMKEHGIGSKAPKYEDAKD